MSRLRISAISYLNTAPLMWDFEQGENAANFDFSYTLPSQCAAQLAQGSADIGIIPAAAYASIPNLAILPGVAIASCGSVKSILLVSKVPLEKIRTVALDTSSLTSVALCKVLFAKWWGGGRTFTPMEPDLDQMLSHADAALLIGDPALLVDRSRYHTYDLAEEWIRFTGKPFVFAFWTIRQEALKEIPESLDLSQVFQRSREHGLEAANLDQIAGDWAPRIGLTENAVREYLKKNIYYYLDEACLEGLRLFYQYANEYGFLASAPVLHFVKAPRMSVTEFDAAV